MGDVIVSEPFKLYSVKIGEHTVYGRPIEWDSDIIDNEGRNTNGDFARPIKYEVTCPYCGNLVFFEPNFDEIKCPHCGKGEFIKSINVETIVDDIIPDSDITMDDIIGIIDEDVGEKPESESESKPKSKPKPKPKSKPKIEEKLEDELEQIGTTAESAPTLESEPESTSGSGPESKPENASEDELGKMLMELLDEESSDAK